MKKYLLLSTFFFSLFFLSCDTETSTNPGGTAVEKMAGDWWVTYEQSVAEYNYLFGGIGSMPDEANMESWDWDYIYMDDHTRIYTFNTAANVSTEMFITDKSNYWDYKVQITVDYDARTFACPTTANLAYEDCNVTIVGGKILEGAGTTPSGMPADSIVFYIKFSDDNYGFTYTKVSGFRRSGFEADDF